VLVALHRLIAAPLEPYGPRPAQQQQQQLEQCRLVQQRGRLLWTRPAYQTPHWGVCSGPCSLPVMQSCTGLQSYRQRPCVACPAVLCWGRCPLRRT
jgi:hypothetical protein